MSGKAARYAITTFVLALVAGSTALADHRYRGEDPLRMLSYKIEKSARYARQAASDSYYWNPFTDRAIHRLHRLEREARDLRRSLKRYGPYSHRTRRDYETLLRAFYDARRSSPALRVSRRAYDEFRRIEYRMDRLRHEFAVRLAYHERRHRHGHGKRRSHDDEFYDGHDRRSARYSD